MTSGYTLFQRSTFCIALILLATLSIPHVPLHAQALPAAVNHNSAPVDRVELYGGAAYFHPFNSDINQVQYSTINYGLVASATGYFNKYVGFQVEGSYFLKGPTDNNCVATAQGGPVLRAPLGRFVPFMHLVGGSAKVGGPANQPCSFWGYGGTGGFGFDIVLPIFHDHLAIRPIQGDVTYSHINNNPPTDGTGKTGGIGEIYAYRLSGGFVFRAGNFNQPMNVTLACAASPESAYPGDPVTLTANALNLKNAKNLSYLWTASALKIDGTDATQNIDTTSLPPGTYPVAGRLVQGSKQRTLASCTASFTVLETQPPTLSCAADRAAINSGDPVVITSTARSPQNLALTYAYTTSNGQIAGNGSTANLTTAGVTPGSINITCTVSDAKGKSATANATVVVATPPPPPPAPQARALCTVAFERDRRRPTRVDNEAKACLDDIALTLGRETDAKLLVVGSHDTNELPQDAAARTLNVSDYLTKEKGIDPARLDLRVGDQPGRLVSNTIVPAGATVDPGTAATFDSSKIKRRGQPYSMPHAVVKPTPKHRTKKKRTAAKPAPSILNKP